MKTISANLQTHLNGSVTTLATIWRIVRTDAVEEFYTNHDQPITYDGDTYTPIGSSFSETAIASKGDLSVDNLEVDIILGGVSRDDILAGVYDHAEVYFAIINYKSVADGIIKIRRGWFGEATLNRGVARIELRGLMEALQHPMMEVVSPTCRAALGDTRCGVDLDTLKVTGTTDEAYWTDDFSSYATGTGLPTGYTHRISGLSTNWHIENDIWQTAGNQLGGKVLENNYDVSGDISHLSMADCDFVSGLADVHMVCKLHSSANWDDFSAGLFARGSGSDGSNNGYYLGIGRTSTTEKFRLGKAVAGVWTELGQVNIPDFAAGAYWLELYVSGSSIKGKWWKDGSARPSTWAWEVTDTSITAAGWNGMVGQRVNKRFDFFSASRPGITPPVSVSVGSATDYSFYDFGRTEADGYFNGGVVTFTGPSNSDLLGFSAEVKTYTASSKEFVLWEPMPASIDVGTTYEMTPGCNKALETCRDTYDNVINFRGEPHLPGNDALMQTPKISEQVR